MLALTLDVKLNSDSHAVQREEERAVMANRLNQKAY